MSSPPVAINTNFEVFVNASAFKRFGIVYPFKGRFRLIIKEDYFRYGDIVEINGLLTRDKQKYPIFDAYIQAPQIRLISSQQGNAFLSVIFNFRKFLLSRFVNVYPEPASGFLAGILLGAKKAIPKWIIEDFKKVGLSHVIALSGYNIVILVVSISALLSFLPRRLGGTLSIFIIAIFVVLVGYSASIVRAAIMASMTIFAKMVGRKSAGLRSLLITAYIMVFLEPLILIYDIGFQLSVAATLGIILFASSWKERFTILPDIFGIRDSFITTCAAQVFTLPIIFVYFRSISVIAPIANIIVLPFIPVLMLGGALGLLIGKIAAAPTWLLFEALIFIVHALAEIPFASFYF